METQRKVGRPKAPMRTGPLVLGDDHERTKITLEISIRAAEELAEYTRWVEKCSGLGASEAKFKTADFALRETFRRDRVWQAQRRLPPPPTSVRSPGPPPPCPRPAATVAPSLPLSPARDPRVGVDGSHT